MSDANTIYISLTGTQQKIDNFSRHIGTLFELHEFDFTQVSSWKKGRIFRRTWIAIIRQPSTAVQQLQAVEADLYRQCEIVAELRAENEQLKHQLGLAPAST